MSKPNPWISHIEAFVNTSLPPDQQNASLDAIAVTVNNDLLTLESLVREMELYLTTADHVIRARGTLLLGEILSRLTSKPLNSAIISSLVGFFTSRLVDWQALQGALVGSLALLTRTRDVGMITASEAKMLTEAYLTDVRAQSLAVRDRKLCFEILQCLLDAYPDAVLSLDDQLTDGILDSIDGEKDPRCLMLTFHLVETVVRMFPNKSGSGASFIADVFEILSCYFPIYFTHQNSNDIEIKRDDLSIALMNAFCSTPYFEPFSIPLLLEKLSSSLPLAKIDSLKYLSKCILQYGSDRMIKHAKAIWFSLKDVIFDLSPQATIKDMDRDTMSQEHQITKEALTCLHFAIMHLNFPNNEPFINLILEDHDIERNFEFVCLEKNYSGISKESQNRLSSLGRILSIASKASNDCCSKVLQKMFPPLMNILGASTSKSSNNILSIMNFGALYLCVELLASCRDLTMVTLDIVPRVQDRWWYLLKDYTDSLTYSLKSALVNAGNTENIGAEHVAILVKGLQLLATFPRNFSPISEEIFEDILAALMSVIISRSNFTLLWRSALDSLVQIGSHFDKFGDSKRKMSYQSFVVERIVSLLSLDDITLSLALKLEAVSVIGTTSQDYMALVIQGLEKAVFINFSEACVDGNMGASDILIPLLECYSKKVLPWSHKFGFTNQIAMSFAVDLWTLMEKSSAFIANLHRQGLLEKTMMTMKLVVGYCTEENQGILVQKSYNALLSTSPQLSNTLLLPLSNSEALHSTSDISDLSSKDEWLVSLFASLVMALRRGTLFPKVETLINFFIIFTIKGHLPSAQALASIINKWPAVSNTENAYKLNEAIDTILKKLLAVLSANIDVNFSCSHPSFHQKVQATVGLAWIGKGLLMRGHEKVKEIAMFLLKYLLANQTIVIASSLDESMHDNHQNMHFLATRAAADAFHILLSDSEDCLNKRFHATIKPLYKQRFFSSMVPIMLSSIKESDSSSTRALLFRALGHILSDSPLAVLVAEAKMIVPPLLEGLIVSSLDVLDKEMTYNLLLVLSGILMDENGKEAIIENAHVIIRHLIKLISYPYMMLVRETTIQCLTAMSALPHTKIYPLRPQVLKALSSSLDDRKRVVRQEAVRCRQAWASIASRSLHF